MEQTVERLIEQDDRETLKGLMHDGKLSGVPSPVKTGWAYRAARLGKADMLRLLVEKCHGMPLEKDALGRTLLHAAASSGDRDTMAFVLQVLGMSALEGDAQGVTPLDVAAETGPQALNTLEELCGVRLAECYRNPVMRGFRPDPSVVRVGEDYYMVNSSFVMLPALPISHSRDLVHWETIGHVFTDPDTAGLRDIIGGFGYWAPDISYYKGRFWVVATLHTSTVPVRTQMITSAPTPAGPWDAPKFLDIDGIDPSIFTDDDGRRYLVTNIGAQIAPLSEQGDLLDEPRMIWYGWNRVKSEGPHLLKKDGWYYLFLAEGGTGFDHVESCARSRNLYGPYESCPFNPILGRKREDAPIGRSGHGKPVQLPDGRWAMVYLCGRKVEGKTLMGRETAVDPLTWTADGWPMVNGLNGPSCLQKHLLPPCPVEAREPWVCPREDWKTFAALRPDGGIEITGGQALNRMSGAHLLLHRETEAAFDQSVTVDVSGLAVGGLAGLTGYYDENSFFLLALRKTDSGAEAALLEQIGPEQKETFLGTLESQQATLSVTGRGLTREARCAGLDRTVSFRAEYLTDEGLKIGKRFTGALLGLAAIGEGTARFREYHEDMHHEGT